MRTLTVLSLMLFALSCAEPDGKLEPNASPNNVNSQNVTPNSMNSMNVTPNSENVMPNSENVLPNNVSPNTVDRPFVDHNSFDNSCEWDSECELTGLGGDVCGCGVACGVSVATAAIPAIEEAVDAVDCTGIEVPPCPDVACEQVLPVCSSGTCDFVGYVETFGEQFDQSCEIDTDCELIQTGVICPACDCGREAINVSDFQRYLDARGSADCNPGPEVCDCEPPNYAACREGMCVAEFAG